MGFRTSLKSIVNQVPGSGRMVRWIRRISGADPERAARLEIRADQSERALADIYPAMNALVEQMAGIESRLVPIEQHVPGLLNTIASANGTSRRLQREISALTDVTRDHAVSINDVLGRLETVRRELMYEIRYGVASATEPVTVEPKVVNEDKLAEACSGRDPVNLGCGHLPLTQYVNVDMRDLPGVDVVAAVDNLPFEPGEVDELFSAHLIEHFPQEQFEREVLPYWISLIRPAGTLRGVLPDAGAMLDGFARGDISYADLREVLYGGQEYEGDFHFNMYTTESLSEILRGAGLMDVTVEAQGRPNGACLEMQISARKPL